MYEIKICRRIESHRICRAGSCATSVGTSHLRSMGNHLLMEFIILTEHLHASLVVYSISVEGKAEIPREYADAVTSCIIIRSVLSVSSRTDAASMPCNIVHHIIESDTILLTFRRGQVIVDPVIRTEGTYLREYIPCDVKIVLHSQLIVFYHLLQYGLGVVQIGYIFVHEPQGSRFRRTESHLMILVVLA